MTKYQLIEDKTSKFPALCSGVTKTLNPIARKYWYESLIKIRNNEEVHLYLPKESVPIRALLIWANNAIESQTWSHRKNDACQAVFVYVWDGAKYRKHDLLLDPECFNLGGTRDNPTYPSNLK